MWIHRVKGTLWRIIPTDLGKMVGEERDVASRQARFFCLDQFTGEVLWEKLTLDDPWWIGIEATHRDIVFFHGFSTPELPEHKMITAVDVLNGKVLWSNKELSFVGADADLVFASSNTALGRAFYALDCRTGEVLHEVPENDVGMKQAQRLRGLSANSDITPPAVVRPHDYLAMIINPHTHPDDIVGYVEAVEVDDLVIFSYHEKTRQSTDQQMDLRNFLKVVNKTGGDVLFQDILNAHCSAPAPESFSVQRRVLYFVKERNELTAIQLLGPHAEE
jgi:hypothetical protein